MEEILYKLSKSKFRSSFKLSLKDKNYIKEKGLDTIRKHAYDFINNRLANYPTLNDGKQTPMKGHPVFIAQHATATCCRICLYKWHKIPSNRQLTNKEIAKIINRPINTVIWIYNKAIKKLKERLGESYV